MAWALVCDNQFFQTHGSGRADHVGRLSYPGTNPGSLPMNGWTMIPVALVRVTAGATATQNKSSEESNIA
jgi:hypothetical protein